MAIDQGPYETDLERTDRLPAVKVAALDPERDADLPSAEVAALRDTLAAHDETIAQLLNSLSERDAELHALQRDHAAVLQGTRQATAELNARVNSNEAEIVALRRALAEAHARTAVHRDQLRRRDRGGHRSRAPDGAAAPAVDYVVQLIRLDGVESAPHVLTTRTRIGRAPGCELQIDSSAVSRQHALLVLERGEVLIEDLNSTNGLVVNGRKVTRDRLHDGDLLTVGDAQFRLAIKADRGSHADL